MHGSFKSNITFGSDFAKQKESVGAGSQGCWSEYFAGIVGVWGDDRREIEGDLAGGGQGLARESDSERKEGSGLEKTQAERSIEPLSTFSSSQSLPFTSQ